MIFRRQISFLKDSITKSEERVKHEIEYLETDYITKFEKLRDEKLQLENQYKEEIHNLKVKCFIPLIIPVNTSTFIILMYK